MKGRRRCRRTGCRQTRRLHSPLAFLLWGLIRRRSSDHLTMDSDSAILPMPGKTTESTTIYRRPAPRFGRLLRRPPHDQDALVTLTAGDLCISRTRAGVGPRVVKLYQREGRSDHVCEGAKVNFISLTRRGLKGQITAFIVEVISVPQAPARGNKERNRLGLGPRQNEN